MLHVALGVERLVLRGRQGRQDRHGVRGLRDVVAAVVARRGLGGGRSLRRGSDGQRDQNAEVNEGARVHWKSTPPPPTSRVSARRPSAPTVTWRVAAVRP